MRPTRLIAWFALIAAVIPAAASPAPPAADSLRVGAVELSLGMPEKTALDSLKRQFRVERARGADDDWAVTERGSTIAIVSFSNEKLNRISKTWMTTDEHEASDLAERLYALAGEFTAQGRTDCVLGAKPYTASGVEGRIVTIACGDKSIQLIQSRTQHGAWVTSLLEVLQ
jgi:hypothetical protein